MELPTTLEDWLGILIQSGIIFSAVWTLFHAVVLKPVTERINTISANCTSNATTLDDLKKKTQASEFDRAALHEKMGNLQGKVDRQAAAFEGMRETMHRDQIELVERLARIEANTNVAGALGQLGETIARAVRER